MTLTEALNSSYDDYIQFCLSENKLKFNSDIEREFTMIMWTKRYWNYKIGNLHG